MQISAMLKQNEALKQLFLLFPAFLFVLSCFFDKVLDHSQKCLNPKVSKVNMLPASVLF